MKCLTTNDEILIKIPHLNPDALLTDIQVPNISDILRNIRMIALCVVHPFGGMKLRSPVIF